MRTWQEARSFAAVLFVIGIVSATTITSCGSGDGESNGDLCEQCGDTDGPCNAAGATVSGDDRPAGCGANDPCTVQLQCVRKVDSSQRRCFPVDPTTSSLDLFYECDGSRPALVPTSTPVPTTTLTPSPTATPADTGPTATGPTPSATGPTPTATPTNNEDVVVDVTIEDPDGDDLPGSFTASVTYPPGKGSFLIDGAIDCDFDEGVTAVDNGSGTLTITFSGDTDGVTFVSAACAFRQLSGQTLVEGDLSGTASSADLDVTIEF